MIGAWRWILETAGKLARLKLKIRNRLGLFLRKFPVERHHIRIADSAAAENVQGRTDGEVNASAPDVGDGFQISQGASAPGVSRGKGRGFGEKFDQAHIDPAAESFNIDGVHQKLAAILGEFNQRITRDGQVSKLLPAIGHDEVLVVTDATAQVKNQAFRANGTGEVFEPEPIDAAFTKNPGGYDDMRGTVVEKGGGILERNSAADLQAVRIGTQAIAGSRFVAGTEHDNVSASKTIAAIKIGIP